MKEKRDLKIRLGMKVPRKGEEEAWKEGERKGGEKEGRRGKVGNKIVFLASIEQDA